ncbi:MAG: anti-sigma regulatory factor [Chloroflexi bacterium]|nr:anti-sigma regulatory factor [Chloroflexota bacterium]
MDVLAAHRRARTVAAAIGFAGSDLTMIATVVSELARNIVLHAGTGEILMAATKQGRCSGIEIVARDKGPGIRDVAQAMRAGYSTAGSLGLGLAAVQKAADEFQITSRQGEGTTVTVRKWMCFGSAPHG